MSEATNELIIKSAPNQQAANELMARLFDISKPEAVYSEPVTVGDYTVINALELTAGMGVGYGGGGGISAKEDASTGKESAENSDAGFGGGGGGGGSTMARPVASIIVGPDGVRVEPIFDITKIIVTFFTTFFSMMITVGKMRKFRQTGKVD